MFYDDVLKSAEYIKSRINICPEICIILGSGLGGVAQMLENKSVIPYIDIPNFPKSSVAGHECNLLVGTVENKKIAVMQGRFHFYEGFTMKQAAYPIYVMKLLGVKSLIVTNACGGINRSFSAGDLMLQTDFINFSGDNPLIGENDERFGPRFPDMSESYSQELMSKARASAERLRIELKEGVYALSVGPCYETAAEVRAYEILGADAVGMSTVPEVTAANYLGIKVLGISCITNMATGICSEKHSHGEVLRVAQESGERLSALICEIVKNW